MSWGSIRAQTPNAVAPQCFRGCPNAAPCSPLLTPVLRKWGCLWAGARCWWPSDQKQNSVSVQLDSSKAGCTLRALTPEQPQNDFSISIAQNRHVHMPQFYFYFLIWVRWYSKFIFGTMRKLKSKCSQHKNHCLKYSSLITCLFVCLFHEL